MGNQQPLQPSDPRTIGGYLVEARLDTGGIGVVFVGRGVDGEAVAINLIRSELAGFFPHSYFRMTQNEHCDRRPLKLIGRYGTDLLCELPSP